MSKSLPNLQHFFVLLFVGLAIFLADNFGFLNIPKRMAFYITNPFSFGIYRSYQTVSKQFYFMFAARASAQENRALKEQLAQIISENAGLKRKLSETESLVEQQQHLDPRTYNLIAARPIGFTRYLKIDKGLDGKLKSGQAIVFKDNYIGKILQVSENSANVQLITDPDSKIAAFSQNKDGKAKGVIIGQFGTESLMDKILHQEKIEVGDLVYSEGTEGFLPRGLVIGRVTQIIDNESLPFKQAKVKPVFDIRDLELVFAIGE